MSEREPPPPTALERIRSHMRDYELQTRSTREDTANARTNFRQSVRHFMEEENVSRVPMTQQDLRELTDIQFFVSHSFVNFASFCCVVAVTFSLGWMGWGRDIVGDYKMIHDEYQVRNSFKRKCLCCSLSIHLIHTVPVYLPPTRLS
jgi:hypothetical protein